jgi:hypothetical protein
VVRLSYLKHLLNIMAVQSSGHQIRYRRPIINKHKRMPTRRLYNNKNRRNRYARRLRRLRRLVY